MVVPGAKHIEARLNVVWDPDGLPPQQEAFLESPEEALDSSVLPQLPMVFSETRNWLAVWLWFQPRRLRISRISNRAAGE